MMPAWRNHGVRVAESARRPPSDGSVLVAGFPKSGGRTLSRVLLSSGFNARTAVDFNAAHSLLEQSRFGIWILDSRGIMLNDPYVWASLRYARYLSRDAPVYDLPRQQAAVLPGAVVVLIPSDGSASVEGIQAAVNMPSLFEWDHCGWNLGVLEVPAREEHLLDLMDQLLAQQQVYESLGGRPEPIRER